MFYILKNNTPSEVPDFRSYMDWHDRLAAQEPNHYPGVSVQIVKSFLHDGIQVSTVFLGTCYGWPPNYDFFETMCFRGIFNDRQWRYSRYSNAVDHHHRIVRQIAIEFLKIYLPKDVEAQIKDLELQRIGPSLWERYLTCFSFYTRNKADGPSNPRTVYYRTDLDSPEPKRGATVCDEPWIDS